MQRKVDSSAVEPNGEVKPTAPASQLETPDLQTPDFQIPDLKILDLRHFSAAQLHPLLAAESLQWKERLSWDYRTSTHLISQYVDARMLPGFVALEGGQALGYVFCVYEEAKAVIGDIFAVGSSDGRQSSVQIERQLAEQMIALLQNSPGTERIESQLLLHPRGKVSPAFEAHGFEVFTRHFMQRSLTSELTAPTPKIPVGLRLRPWEDSDFNHAARLITEAYAGHIDSHINDQYQSLAGSLRFLHNIIRFPSCGHFHPGASHILESAATGEMVGLLLSSRIMERSAHITQICIAPRWRYRGFGEHLLAACLTSLQKLNFLTVSLTVTGANSQARRLYERMAFQTIHEFDAMIWSRHPHGIGLGLV